MKTAIITGIFGQDGSYLAEQLVDDGYRVYGTFRAPLSPGSVRLKSHLEGKGLSLVAVEDAPGALTSLVSEVQPDEVYHLAATHFSVDQMKSLDTDDAVLFRENVNPTLELLEAVRRFAPRTKVCLAGSCLIFENGRESPQSEESSIAPGTVYGTAKAASMHLANVYRAKHGIHASTAILYNHESPRRSDSFVSQKIVKGLVNVAKGQSQHLPLRNITGRKDWGFAGDYMHAMRLMTASPTSANYVIASGVERSVADFVQTTCHILGISDWRAVVSVQEPPPESRSATPPGVTLVGDPKQALLHLGWRPKVSFEELVRRMVSAAMNGMLD